MDMGLKLEERFFPVTRRMYGYVPVHMQQPALMHGWADAVFLW